jgi:hypothetical protein
LRAISIATIMISFLAIVYYMASNMHRDSHPIQRMREECQRTHGDEGTKKVTECITDLALRYAGRSHLP